MSPPLSFTSPLAPPLPIRRFSVEQYHRLGELGVLTPEDKVELLEGWIVEKMNQRPIHGYIVRLLTELFQRELPSGWVCQCQLPVTTERSEPEPDVAILKGTHTDFRDHHPRGSDCRLIVEVADTSLEKDRAKVAIYRDAGVQEYWIIDVAGKCLERYEFSGSSETNLPEIFPSDSEVGFHAGQSGLSVRLARLFE